MWKARILVGTRSVLTCAGLILACGCDDPSLSELRKSGLLRVGYAVEAPYAMVSRTGDVTGESPETAKELARRVGVPRIEWVQTAFEALIPDLLERRFDVVAAGLFMTSAREKQVRFSRPTVRVIPGLLVRKGNPQNLASFGALTPRAGLRVAIIAGSVEQSRLTERGFGAEHLLVVPDAQTGKAAVAQGIAQAFALSLPTVRWMANGSPDVLEALPDPGASTPNEADYVAFAFHPHDAALAKSWDAAEESFIGSPRHVAIISRFGFDARDAVTAGAPAGLAR